MSEPVLALAVSARDWPDRLRGFLADHGGARVRLTALSVHDLTSEAYDVLFIDDISSMLSRGLVNQLHASARKVVGVHDPAEPHGRELLVELGVDTTVASDDRAEALVDVARSFAARSRSDAPRPVSDATPTRQLGGSLVDVRGVSGGVGTSEVALALGLVLAESVVVELGPLPSLAQRLGLQLHPNIATAVEVVDHTDGDVGAVLQPVSATARVLVGTSEPFSAGRGAARRVVDAVRRTSRWAIIDGGAVSTAPAASDQTLFVTSATPVGIVRCVDALRSRDLTQTHVVLNRSPRGSYERSELLGAVLSEIRPRSVTLVPDDSAVTSAAWNGNTVRTGPFTKAIDALAHAVVEAA